MVKSLSRSFLALRESFSRRIIIGFVADPCNIWPICMTALVSLDISICLYMLDPCKLECQNGKKGKKNLFLTNFGESMACQLYGAENASSFHRSRSLEWSYYRRGSWCKMRGLHQHGLLQPFDWLRPRFRHASFLPLK